MSQNIYDDPEFFAGYATLDRSVKGLDGAPEWPAIQAMLPALQGKTFSIWAADMAGFVATRAIIMPPASWGWISHKRC